MTMIERTAHRRPYLDDARAALKAMREPTDAMLYAGATALEAADPGLGLEHVVLSVYRAMIDAALSEGHE